MTNQLRAGLAELVGTFIFIFVGAGAIVTDSYTHGAVGLLGIALANGLILSVMISTLGSVSGGYFNPAITFGLWVGEKIKTPTLVLYIIAQLIGGTLAGFALRVIFPAVVWMPVHLGTPGLTAGVSATAGLIIEILLTFILVVAVYGTSVDAMSPKIGGFGIGLTAAAALLLGWPLTGAAMNPARVLGTALASGFWDNHWLYWAGPLFGGGVAGWLYTRFLSKTV